MSQARAAKSERMPSMYLRTASVLTLMLPVSFSKRMNCGREAGDEVEREPDEDAGAEQHVLPAGEAARPVQRRVRGRGELVGQNQPEAGRHERQIQEQSEQKMDGLHRRLLDCMRL